MTFYFKKYIFLSIFFTFFAQFLFAQNDPLTGQDSLVLENERIDGLIRFDKPNIKLPSVNTKIPSDTLNYTPNSFTPAFNYTVAPLSAKLYEKQETFGKLNNYVKLGFGRFASPIGKLFINNGNDPNWSYGLQLEHNSSFDGYTTNAEYMKNKGAAHLNYTGESFNVSSKISGTLRDYKFFADSFKNEAGEYAPNQQNYLKVAWENLFSTNSDTGKNEFSGGLSARYFSDKQQNSEFHFIANGLASLPVFKDLNVLTEARVIFSSTEYNSVSQGKNLFEFKPAIEFNGDKLKFKLGINLSNYADSTSAFTIFPDVFVNYQLIEKQLDVFAKMTGKFAYNQQYEMIEENPYLYKPIIPTSHERFKISAGFHANFGKIADLEVSGSYASIKNYWFYYAKQPAYFDIITDSLTKKFEVISDFNVQVNPKLVLGYSFIFNQFSLSHLPIAYHVPNITSRLYGKYKLNEKLNFGMSGFYVSRRDFAEKVNLDGSTTTIYGEAYFDLNFDAEYRFNERFSAWFQLNNILNNQYQRWFYYNERPIDFKVGGTFSF